MPRPHPWHVGLVFALALAACVPTSRRTSAPATTAGTAKPTRPVWQARKVVPDAVNTADGRIHTVKPGETGIAIARAYGVEWSRIAATNNLKPPYTLEIGDKLRLPSARQAAAQVAAMTLEERARAFTLDIDDIITGGEPAAPDRPRAVPGRPPRAAPTALPVLAGPAPLFRWPVEGRILSTFGAKPGGRFNDGVNLKASAGAPVVAAAAGVVAYAGDAIPGFGNLVLVKHAGGYVTAYAHNEALLVTRGKRLGQGEVLARAGATGAVTEPQVHFEIRRGRTPVDPTKLISRS